MQMVPGNPYGMYRGPMQPGMIAGPPQMGAQPFYPPGAVGVQYGHPMYSGMMPGGGGRGMMDDDGGYRGRGMGGRGMGGRGGGRRSLRNKGGRGPGGRGSGTYPQYYSLQGEDGDASTVGGIHYEDQGSLEVDTIEGTQSAHDGSREYAPKELAEES